MTHEFGHAMGIDDHYPDKDYVHYIMSDSISFVSKILTEDEKKDFYARHK